MGSGEWGVGSGEWGVGSGRSNSLFSLFPIPHSPFPIPHSPLPHRLSVSLPARGHRLGALDLHFIEQIIRAAELFRQEQHVTIINCDGAIGADVVSVIAAQSFVIAVEDEANDFAAPVHQRAA